MPHLRVYAFSSRTTPDGWDLRDVLQPAAACIVDERALNTPHRCVQGFLALQQRCCCTLQLLGVERADGGVPPFIGPLFSVPFEVDSLLLAAEPVGGSAASSANDARLSLLFVGWADSRVFLAARLDAILEPRWAALVCACAAIVCAA
jgi:hypothetical protein